MRRSALAARAPVVAFCAAAVACGSVAIRAAAQDESLSALLGEAGQKERSLVVLQRFFDTPNHLHLSRKQVETDPDFEALKGTPEFLRLLDKAYAGNTPELKR
jgi:hypothetical protein